MSKLFNPLRIGNMELHHRVVMAPLTRFRSDDNWVPLPIVKEYYTQRACVPGTLIISEATIVSRRESSYFNVPGIWSDAQIAAWKEIVDAVHAKGGYMVCQLWNMGRAGDPAALKSVGSVLRSSSAVPIGPDYETPKELTEEEIQQAIADYVTAAKNAVERAGFDGVEIHGANGYLVDQFLQDTCNNRTDGWGGSIEKRARFALEVTRAVVDAIGADRTGIRLSPWSDFQGMLMKDPYPQFEYVTRELKKMSLMYLHVVEARISGNADTEAGTGHDVGFLVKAWGNSSPVLVAGGFKPESAQATIEKYKDYDVAIVFGRYFVSNPDLVFRVKESIDLVKYDRNVFYTPGRPEGYIDYPFSEEFMAQA